MVGSVADDISGKVDQGSAYVFERRGNRWVEQARLTASDGAAGDFFGFSVALRGDHVIVGGAAHAYVYERQGYTWVQQASLTASDGTTADFGFTVTIDRNTAVAGAPDTDSGKGSAYVYRRQGNQWVQRARLQASDGAAGDSFGNSVALNDGVLVVGAPNANRNQGSAYVFTRDDGQWVQRARLTASDGAADDLFSLLAVAVSGNTVVIGASGAHGHQGSAYLFQRQGHHWTEQARLTASDGAAGDNFGFSVAVDRRTVVVGANLDDIDTKVDQGSAYVFRGVRRSAEGDDEHDDDKHDEHEENDTDSGHNHSVRRH